MKETASNPLLDDYRRDLILADRTFRVSQRLVALAQVNNGSLPIRSRGETDLMPECVGWFQRFKLAGPAKIALEACVPDRLQGEDTAELAWCPFFELDLPDCSRLHRPTSFEVQDLQARVERALDGGSELPMALGTLRPEPDLWVARYLTPREPKPNIVYVRQPELTLKEVDIRPKNGKVYHTELATHGTRFQLLSLAEANVDSAQAEPFVVDCDVELTDVGQFESMEGVVKEKKRFGSSGGYIHDISSQFYRRLSEVVLSKDLAAVGVVRRVDLDGRIVAYSLYDLN